MTKEELHDLICEKQPNICQISCYRDGCEVYSDEWHAFKKADTTHVMSVTKSIVALLIGIAIDQGLIKSEEEIVLSFFPEYKVKRGEKTIQHVTIRHLLTMTAPYKYKYEPWSKVCSSEDWTVAALDVLGGKKGLTGDFLYSTLGIHILTGIIAKVSHMAPVDFANQYLFEPVGVACHKNYLAETVEEHKQFMLSKEPKENIWFCDPQGVGTAGYGLCFSAGDMAKIGQLCLDKGKCKGKQVVSEKWIEKISSPSSGCLSEFRNIQYGYLWWITDAKKKVYSAIGNSGNIIYINSAKNLVVAITALFKPTIFDRVDFIQEVVEPFLCCNGVRGTENICC